ncbi:MAG TPA: DUF4293 domain-containing protein [Bacteroidales bacterium]|nr:DUF4293 domain-containing protein [Bacteroidales bacterium]
MLQRIQTVYLALAAIAMILIFFFPFALFQSEFIYSRFYVYGLVDMVPGGANNMDFIYALPLILADIGVVVLTVGAIFRYKNRPSQIKLANAAFILTIIFIAAVFFLYGHFLEKRFSTAPIWSEGIGVYFPLIAMVFIMLAIRAIRRDENLVRSTDRLR